MADKILDDTIINEPVADEAARNAIPTADLQPGVIVLQLDTLEIYEWNGTTWFLKETPDWVALPTYTGNWTSNAFIAKFDNGTKAMMRGDFVSTADNNDDAFGTYPAGFTPAHAYSVSGTAQIMGNFRNFKNESGITWSGGGSSLTHPSTGIRPSDNVLPVIQNGGTPQIFGIRAQAGTDQIDFAISNVNPDNDVVFGYAAIRDENILEVDIGTDSGVFGTSYTVNTGDKVYVDGVTYSLV